MPTDTTTSSSSAWGADLLKRALSGAGVYRKKNKPGSERGGRGERGVSAQDICRAKYACTKLRRGGISFYHVTYRVYMFGCRGICCTTQERMFRERGGGGSIIYNTFCTNGVPKNK